MCATCGCSDEAATRVLLPLDVHHEHDGDPHEHPHEHPGHEHGHDHPGHEHDHHHEHPGHEHQHDPSQHAHDGAVTAGETIAIEQNVLAKNDLLAARNRGWFEG